MYLVFAMIGVLLYSAFMRTGFNRPPLWSVEMSQFLLVAYFILGGAWTLQLDSHVRMDLLYARWTPKSPIQKFMRNRSILRDAVS